MICSSNLSLKVFDTILQIFENIEEFENCHFIPTYIPRRCSLLMEDNGISNLFTI